MATFFDKINDFLGDVSGDVDPEQLSGIAEEDVRKEAGGVAIRHIFPFPQCWEELNFDEIVAHNAYLASGGAESSEPVGFHVFL